MSHCDQTSFPGKALRIPQSLQGLQLFVDVGVEKGGVGGVTYSKLRSLI